MEGEACNNSPLGIRQLMKTRNELFTDSIINNRVSESNYRHYTMESLILAQDER
jgi:hypothetical protein